MAEPASIELSNVALGDPRKKLRQVALRCLARLTKKELISEVVFHSIQEILNSESVEETILVIQIINEARDTNPSEFSILILQFLKNQY